jgi:hypothetical protein
MGRTLDPATQDWHQHYRDADRRRRRAGWHRRGPSKPKRHLDANRLVAIVMGVAAAVVLICLAIPG